MNFATMKSMFGDYWVGKTNLKVNGVGVFATFEEATEKAMELNDSVNNLQDLQDATEFEAETISLEAQRWIITS